MRALLAGDPSDRLTASEARRPGGRRLQPWELQLLLLLVLCR
jgi:hypothetical protein